MKKVLLMSISNTSDWLDELQNLREIYRPVGKILVLEHRFDEEYKKIWITFNCSSDHNFKRFGVIKVNRNKDTNTLFTIDALNALSVRETGKVDKNFVPNWNEFENCLLIHTDGDMTVIPTKIKKIYDLV